MRTFDIRYEMGNFFHKSLAKAVTKLSKWKNEKWKTSISDSLSHLNQQLSQIDLLIDSITLAEIKHLSKNQSLIFSKLGKNFQRILVSVKLLKIF